MVAQASVTSGTKGGGSPGTQVTGARGHRGASRAAPHSAPPRARRRLAHACAPARTNYQIPGLQAVHPRTGRACAPRSSPAVSSELGLMFPCPGRSVSAGQSPPRRALATRLDVGAQPGAQRCPFTHCGSPDGALGLGAQGTSLTDPTSAHSCPALRYPQRQRGQEGRKAGCPVPAEARAGATQAGTRPGCGRGSGVGPAQLPTVRSAVAGGLAT